MQTVFLIDWPEFSTGLFTGLLIGLGLVGALVLLKKFASRKH